MNCLFFSFCNFNLFPLSLTWCIALLMMGAKLQKDGVMQSLGVRYIYLINHKIHEKGPKNTVKDAALQRSLLQRGVQPLCICWLFRQKGQRAVFFWGQKKSFSGNVRQDGGTPTYCYVIADFCGVSEIAFLNPFPMKTFFAITLSVHLVPHPWASRCTW